MLQELAECLCGWAPWAGRYPALSPGLCHQLVAGLWKCGGFVSEGPHKRRCEGGCSSCHCPMQKEKRKLTSHKYDQAVSRSRCGAAIVDFMGGGDGGTGGGGGPHPVQLLVLMATCCMSVNFLLLAEAGSCPDSWHLSGHLCMGMQAESRAQPSPPSSDLGVIKGQCLQHWL